MNGQWRWLCWLPLLLIALGLANYREPVGLVADDAMYLLTANYFSPWAPASDVARQAFMISVFPPLYPMMLGLINAGSYPEWGRFLNVCLMFVFAAGFARWAGGINGWLAATAALLAPISWQLMAQIYAEPLFLCLLLLALHCHSRLERPNIAIGLLLGLALVTRSAAIAWVIAWIIWQIWQRNVSVRSLTALLLPTAVWTGYRMAVQVPQDDRESYLHHMLDFTQPERLPAFLAEQGVAAWHAWIHQFSLQPTVLTQALALAVLLLAGYGWWPRLRRGEWDAWGVLLTIAMLLLWPFANHFPRLMYPLLPFMIWYAFLAAASLGTRVATGVYLGVLAQLGMATLLIASRALIPDAVVPRGFQHSLAWWEADLAAGRQTMVEAKALQLAAQEVPRFVPAGSCVYSVVVPFIMYQSGRISRFPPKPGRPELCDYYLLLPIGGVAPPFHPWPQIQARSEVLAVRQVQNAEGKTGIAAMLVRVRR